MPGAFPNNSGGMEISTVMGKLAQEKAIGFIEVITMSIRFRLYPTCFHFVLSKR